MDEKDLEMLKKLTETPNITKAAQELFTTQPSLTKRVQKLEAELGCRLFARSRKGLQPMPVMERILPRVELILKTLAELHDESAHFSGQVAGSLKIGASINFARYRMPRLLKSYTRRYPLVQISLWANQSSVLYPRLQKGELSLAILRGEYPWDEGDILLSQEPVCLVQSRENAHIPLEELPYIGRKTDPLLESQFLRWREEQGLMQSKQKSRISVNDISTCLAMVEQGIGWALLPGICLKGFDGVVRPLAFQDGTAFMRSTHLLYRESAAFLPQVKAFIDEALDDAGAGA